MFSNLWSVTGFLSWAETEGCEPLVDFQTDTPMNHWESDEPRNAWTDYFEQTSGLDLGDVLKSGHTLYFPTVRRLSQSRIILSLSNTGKPFCRESA